MTEKNTNQVTQEMLNKAMKEAVKQGLFPKYTDEETYLNNWATMKKILISAMS